MDNLVLLQDNLRRDVEKQLKFLNDRSGIIPFDKALEKSGLHPLTATNVEVLQINLGKICNQTCKHCHVDAGPERKEIMTKNIMKRILNALDETDIPVVDLTGGAPEMNPDFKWFVSELKNRHRQVIVRSNLTILVTRPFAGYPQFLKEMEVIIISSLPYFLEERTDQQRGTGVFQKSIESLRILNDLGYGKPDSGLELNLVYNPTGAFLPPSQSSIEELYKKELKQRYNIEFNHLYTITNMPISRFLVYLIHSNNYDRYMKKLHASYNPAAAMNVMCRTTLSVSWDGYLYDCDFNQMLELTVNHGAPTHIDNFDFSQLANRRIVTGQHCYGCTAGAGSSCGGAIV
jgi:radical SAM/Cys-rich protein